MIRWLRRSSWLIVPFAMVIAAMVVVGTVDWWHADDEDVALPAFHDHSAHQPVFRSAHAVAPGADHCYLCHWLRTLGNGFGSVAEHHVSPNTARRVPYVVNCRASDLVAASLPARAPPA